MTPDRPKMLQNHPKVTLFWSQTGPILLTKWAFYGRKEAKKWPKTVKNVDNDEKKTAEKPSTPSEKCIKRLKIH